MKNLWSWRRKRKLFPAYLCLAPHTAGRIDIAPFEQNLPQFIENVGELIILLSINYFTVHNITSLSWAGVSAVCHPLVKAEPHGVEQNLPVQK